MPHHSPTRIFTLPFGIQVTVADRHTHLTSELRSQLVDEAPSRDDPALAAVHAIESLLLALVARGIDLGGPDAARAVEDAVESVAEYLCCI